MVARKLILGILLVVLCPLIAQAEDSAGLFKQGNVYFEQKQYDSAIANYQAILESGVESAPVYFNLGNAYFRQGDLGHAILNFLKARRLDPDNEDIIANLEYARRYTSVQMEGVKLNPVRGFLESMVSPYRLSTLAWLASVFFVLLMLFLTVRYGLGFKNSWVRAGVAFSLILLLASGSLATAKYDFEYLTDRGVIVSEQATVRTGPSTASERELEASPGLIVEIVDQSGDWYNVIFENLRRGWIRKELVAVV